MFIPGYVLTDSFFYPRELMLLPGSTVVATDTYTAIDEGHISLAKGKEVLFGVLVPFLHQNSKSKTEKIRLILFAWKLLYTSFFPRRCHRNHGKHRHGTVGGHPARTNGPVPAPHGARSPLQSPQLC